MTLTGSGEREHRIDIIRGFALLTILINHATDAAAAAGMLGWGIITPTQVGYSSAAELFVFLSGYMVGLVYLRSSKPRSKLIRRSIELYVYNALLFASVIALTWSINTDRFAAFVRYDYHGIALMSYTKNFLLLQRGPHWLDILQLYVIFLFAFSLVVPLAKKSPWLLFAISTLLWFAVQSDAVVRDYSDPATKGPYFQPLAWQFLFVSGVMLGRIRFHKTLFTFFEGKSYLIIPIFLILVLSGVHKVSYTLHMAPPVPWGGRNKLGGALIVHTALILLFYCGILSVLRNHLANPILRFIGMMGRNTLNCFIASIVLTYLLAAVMMRYGGNYFLYLSLTALLVVIVAGVAALSDARSRRKKAAQARLALGA